MYGALTQSPWQFGWEALAAIGTLLAVAAALFLPWQAQHAQRAATKRMTAERTRVAAHEIAVDLNEINVHMMESLRIVMQAMNVTLDFRTVRLQNGLKAGFLQFPDLAPNLSVQDLDWLADPVRQELARMRGQIRGFNRLALRVIMGPFVKFPNAEQSVLHMFPTTVRLMLSMEAQCSALMKVLRPYLGEEFDGLETSMQNQSKYFMALGAAIAKLDAEREQALSG